MPTGKLGDVKSHEQRYCLSCSAATVISAVLHRVSRPYISFCEGLLVHVAVTQNQTQGLTAAVLT